MKYTNVILESLKKTGLKRIRIKVDPLFADKLDFKNAASYEGYVLNECESKLKILVVPDGVTLDDIPEDMIEYIAQDGDGCGCSDSESMDVDEDQFNNLKQFIIQTIAPVKGSDSPVCQQIINCTNLNDVETMLQQAGFDQEDMNIIYKSFIFSDDAAAPVTEARMRDYVTAAAKKTGKSVINPRTYIRGAKAVNTGLGNLVSGAATGIEKAVQLPGQIVRGARDVVIGGDVTPITGGLRNAANTTTGVINKGLNAADSVAAKTGAGIAALKVDAEKRAEDAVTKSLYQPIKLPNAGATVNIDIGEVDAAGYRIRTPAKILKKQQYKSGFVYDVDLRGARAGTIDAMKIAVSPGSGTAQTFYYKNGVPIKSPEGYGFRQSNYFAYDPLKKQWQLSAEQPTGPELYSVSRIMNSNPDVRLSRGNVIQVLLGRGGKKQSFEVIDEPDPNTDTVILKKVS